MQWQKCIVIISISDSTEGIQHSHATLGSPIMRQARQVLQTLKLPDDVPVFQLSSGRGLKKLQAWWQLDGHAMHKALGGSPG